MNPDKKGEKVTERRAGLSEELMNTSLLLRGKFQRKDQGWGSTVQEGGG